MRVYDFDGTIYDGDSSVDLYFHCLRENPFIVRYIPFQIWGFILFFIGQIDKTMLKEHFFVFLKGVDIKHELAEFWKCNSKKIKKWYLDQSESDDLIISASPEFLLQPILDQIGVKNLIASKVDEYTGKYTGKNCEKEEKKRRFLNEYGDTAIDAFYFDTLSDIPMAKLARESYIVKKDKIEKWEKI